MKLEVRNLRRFTGAVQQVDRWSTSEDEEYARSMGYTTLYDALLHSCRNAERVYGVFDEEDYCVALVGVEPALIDGLVWAHTSMLIRNQPKVLLPALSDVVAKLDEDYPGFPLFAIYRSDDESIRKMTEYAGFTKDKANTDLNGIKHTYAWR